jgi:hypothetical protein
LLAVLINGNKTEENMKEIIGGLVVAAVFYVFLVVLFLF